MNAMRLFLSLLSLALSGMAAAQCLSGDCVDGRGEYRFPSGARYVGEFREGAMHGTGTCYYPDGSVYVGQWADRYPHGYGIKRWPDGLEWKGQWIKGQPVDARGQLIPDLHAYAKSHPATSGCLSGDCIDGIGDFLYPDGRHYRGSFRAGLPDGQGEMVWPDSGKYVGRFEAGKPHGPGTFYRQDGQVQEGLWRQGHWVGPAPDAPAIGCLEGDCQNGYGRCIFEETGARYEGTFLNGLPHGQGIMYFPEGDWYEGAFAEGVFEGTGTYHATDGSVLHGTWKDGAFVAEQEPTLAPAMPSEGAAVPSSSPGNIWAIVIGISWYEHMQALRYTDDDAWRFWGFLLSPAGGAVPEDHIRLLIDENATRDSILHTLEEVVSRVDSNDYFVLFYSGHGINGAFLPSDYDGTGHVLSHDELREWLERCPARFKLVLADACHAGSYSDLAAKGVNDIASSLQMALRDASPGTAIILSSRAEELSLESDKLKQGVFSHFLLRGLKGEADTDGDGIVVVQELFDYVQQQVQRYTDGRQRPAIFGNFDPKMPVSVVRR